MHSNKSENCLKYNGLVTDCHLIFAFYVFLSLSVYFFHFSSVFLRSCHCQYVGSKTTFFSSFQNFLALSLCIYIFFFAVFFSFHVFYFSSSFTQSFFLLIFISIQFFLAVFIFFFFLLLRFFAFSFLFFPLFFCKRHSGVELLS